MYRCTACGSIDPDHRCPGPQEDITEEANNRQKEFRLRRILELEAEGLTLADIGAEIGISEASVRSILQRYRLNELDLPLESSLAVSLTNHAPNELALERIKKLRLAADKLCLLLDDLCLEGHEISQAKTHLEETVMWGVKAIVLPRENGEFLTPEMFRQRLS